MNYSKSIYIVVLMLFCAPVLVHSQDDSTTGQRINQGDYRIIFQTNLGLSSSSINRSTTIDKAEYSTIGFLGTIRAMWRPDHLLALGIETGRLSISNTTVKEDASLPVGSTIHLRAFPLLAVFSMEKYGIEISSAVGSYNYSVEAIINSNETATSSQWEIGWMMSVGYSYPLTSSLGVGGDIRYYSIPERNVALPSVSAKVQWQFWY